jgi:rRNA maturation endonuclease Nob1
MLPEIPDIREVLLSCNGCGKQLKSNEKMICKECEEELNKDKVLPYDSKQSTIDLIG